MNFDLQSEGTVVRTVRMMTLLAGLDGEIGVNQLADQVNLAPSTVHRLLKLLCDEGIAAWNPVTRGYSSGPELYRLGARVVGAMPLPRIVEPLVRRLADEFDETVLFGLHLPREGEMAFVTRADGHQSLQYRIPLNEPTSLLWGASGKAILAYLDRADIERVHAVAGSSPATAAAKPSLAELIAELEEVRRAGVAVTESQKLSGARGIGAPVFGPHGVVGCLVLTSPIDRMPHTGIAKAADAIRATAAEVSGLLGRQGP
ncbi:IclR family transcriptional regulator [Streptomyces sp. NPDC047000]|uniref:IclR family transcriptional regulator n=1 Tax=Streptomyces sp. NPDC047000 TaxID=3155474 RepID=UPI0033FE6EDB